MFGDGNNLSKADLEEGVTLAPRFDANGLITAVVQDYKTGEVLMLAHMNSDALEQTLTSGFAHFWSRSRQELWKKGETSGNTLRVEEVRIDCDQDAVIVFATLNGKGACHTGVRSCFFRSVEKDINGYHLVRLPNSES